MFRGLKAWIKTRKPENANVNDLMDAIKFGDSVKRLFSRIWSAIIGICTIIAAVFSVLSFFKN